MGMFILVFTITIILICISFLNKNNFQSHAYVWGIRLVLFFCFFHGRWSNGGSLSIRLVALMADPVTVINWSNRYGDLRIAHFIGIHSLQVLPLFGNYFSKTKKQTLIFSVVYFLLASALFLQAMNGIPLFF
jgi:hypothetical protein